MFTAYFDAAGKERGQKHLVGAGFAATTEICVEFDRLWPARLHEDGLAYFHMVHLAACRREFKEGWRDGSRRRKLLGDAEGLRLHCEGRLQG